MVTERDDDPEDGHPELVSNGVAAQLLGKGWSAQTLWRAAVNGDLKPVSRTPGGHLRWDMADLRQQVSALEEQREAERKAKREGRGE